MQENSSFITNSRTTGTIKRGTGLALGAFSTVLWFISWLLLLTGAVFILSGYIDSDMFQGGLVFSQVLRGAAYFLIIIGFLILLLSRKFRGYSSRSKIELFFMKRTLKKLRKLVKAGRSKKNKATQISTIADQLHIFSIQYKDFMKDIKGLLSLLDIPGYDLLALELRLRKEERRKKPNPKILHFLEVQLEKIQIFDGLINQIKEELKLVNNEVTELRKSMVKNIDTYAAQRSLEVLKGFEKKISGYKQTAFRELKSYGETTAREDNEYSFKTVKKLLKPNYKLKFWRPSFFAVLTSALSIVVLAFVAAGIYLGTVIISSAIELLPYLPQVTYALARGGRSIFELFRVLHWLVSAYFSVYIFLISITFIFTILSNYIIHSGCGLLKGQLFSRFGINLLLVSVLVWWLLILFGFLFGFNYITRFLGI